MPHNVILLRKDNGDGTSKDWAAAEVPETSSNGVSVVVWFGPTGGTLQYRKIPPERWKSSSSAVEVRTRYAEKQAKGYVAIGSCHIEDDLSLEIGEAVNPIEAPSAPAPKKLVYYEVFISRRTQRTREQIMNDYMAMIRRLVSEIEGARLDGAVFAVRIGAWSMHVDIGTRGTKCAGQIDPQHGVRPLLFLMALKKAAPKGVEVNLARDDQVEISHHALCEEEVLSWFETTPDEIAVLAEKLGLVMSIVDQTRATGQPDFYF